MNLTRKICCFCRDRFTPNPRTARIQKACLKPACRRHRKRQADARWRSRNPDYDKSRATKKRTWAQQYPDYWQHYRAAHSDYTERNRRQTQQRMKALRRLFANQDAIQRNPVGYLQGLGQKPLFANQDAIARSIDGVVLYLLIHHAFANPNAIATERSAGG